MCMSVPMGVSVRVGVSVRMVMLVVMPVVEMIFMFHQVRIPLMLECLHAPQRREKNTRP